MKMLIFALVFPSFLVFNNSAGPGGDLTGGGSLYDGLCCTRGTAPNVQRAEAQAMSRYGFFTRSAVTKLKIVVPNWYNGETATGSSMTVTASVEYNGTCTPFTWSSSSSVSIASGSQATSDYITVSIPTNTQAWIRTHYSNASGVPVNGFQGQNIASMGDALAVGNSVTDSTVSCATVTDGGTFESAGPLAIIAPITAPAVCGFGDSIMLGVNNDHTPNSTGDNGEVMPSISPSFGYSNMGVNGDTASAFVSTHTNRVAILQYCSHLIVEYGTNDIYLNGDSVATLEGHLTTIYGYGASNLVSPKTVFQTTLIARTTSTDSWATTANQSTITGETSRVSFNGALTGATFGPNGGEFDPQPVVGTLTNNSIWKAGAGFPTCSPWTTDGVHPSTCAYYTVLQTSGYIDTTRITTNATGFLTDCCSGKLFAR